MTLSLLGCNLQDNLDRTDVTIIIIIIIIIIIMSPCCGIKQFTQRSYSK
jgi:hypothetical protein